MDKATQDNDEEEILKSIDRSKSKLEEVKEKRNELQAKNDTLRFQLNCYNKRELALIENIALNKRSKSEYSSDCERLDKKTDSIVWQQNLKHVRLEHDRISRNKYCEMLDINKIPTIDFINSGNCTLELDQEREKSQLLSDIEVLQKRICESIQKKELIEKCVNRNQIVQKLNANKLTKLQNEVYCAERRTEKAKNDLINLEAN